MIHPSSGHSRGVSRLLRRSAFSTPELLMTILIFSFGMLPLIVLFQSSHKTTAQAKNLMIAQSLGRTIVDEVRSLGFAGVRRELDNPTFGLFHDWQQVKGKMVESDDTSITWPTYYERFETKVAANADDDANPTKYRIEMEVRWREPDRTFSLGFGTVVVNYAEN